MMKSPSSVETLVPTPHACRRWRGRAALPMSIARASDCVACFCFCSSRRCSGVLDDGNPGEERERDGHVHTLLVMLGDVGGCPQRRAEIQARLRAESQPFLRLSEPSLHIIHPVATSLRARRQAKQHIVVMISNGVEGGTVLNPCNCKCDHVGSHGYRLPAEHLEVEHHVDELICSSALVRCRPSCRAALHVSLGAMALGSCADTSTATRRPLVFLVDVHGCSRAPCAFFWCLTELTHAEKVLMRPRW